MFVFSKHITLGKIDTFFTASAYKQIPLHHFPPRRNRSVTSIYENGIKVNYAQQLYGEPNSKSQILYIGALKGLKRQIFFRVGSKAKS